MTVHFSKRLWNHDLGTVGRPNSTAEEIADSNTWAFTMNETAHDNKHAGVSNDQTRSMSMRTDFVVVTTT